MVIAIRLWTVPILASASTYTSKVHLHWSGVTLNGGAINAEGGDAVEIVAYFGEASGTANGSLSGGDANGRDRHRPVQQPAAASPGLSWPADWEMDGGPVSKGKLGDVPFPEAPEGI